MSDSISVASDAVYKAVFDKKSFEVWDAVIHDQYGKSDLDWFEKRDHFADELKQTFKSDIETAVKILREKAPGEVSEDALVFIHNVYQAVNWYAVAGYMLAISERIEKEAKMEEKE